jgi:hypothetical protein
MNGPACIGPDSGKSRVVTMQMETVRNEPSTQEIDIGDIFEVRQLAKRASSSSVPPPLPRKSVRLSQPVIAAPVIAPPVPEPAPSAPLPSFDESADVESVVLTRESASKLALPDGPVELPTLRSLKAITKWRALTTLASETLRVPHMSLAQAASALRNPRARVDASDLTKTRIHLPSRARAIVARLRALPTPVWASISAMAAALVVGLGAVAASGHAAPLEAHAATPIVTNAGVQNMPEHAALSIAPTLHASESTARWSDVPAIIADAPPPLEPQPESEQK